MGPGTSFQSFDQDPPRGWNLANHAVDLRLLETEGNRIHPLSPRTLTAKSRDAVDRVGIRGYLFFTPYSTLLWTYGQRFGKRAIPSGNVRRYPGRILQTTGRYDANLGLRGICQLSPTYSDDGVHYLSRRVLGSPSQRFGMMSSRWPRMIGALALYYTR